MTDVGKLSKGGGWHSTEEFIEGAGKSKQVLACSFVDRGGAGAYTVMFSVPGAVPGAPRPNILADITWFVQGAVKRTVSVQNGTSITGVAEAVEVTIRDAPLGPIAVPPRKYKVVTLVAKGNRGVFKQPPYLAPILVQAGNKQLGYIILPPSSNFSFNIPVDSGIVSVYTTAHWNDNSIATPVGNSDFVIQQFGSGAFKQYDARNSDWIPVIPNMQSMSFFNNNAVVAGGAVFTVAFGIDG